jgi:Family of unknown function (DUF6801)
MKWTARTARRVPRAAARTAALFGMVAASGLAAGVASASGSHPTAARPATVSLTYRCHFPAGPHPVKVGVTATVPAAAKTGRPIQPTGVTLTMALPPAAVSALASLHSPTVGAVTRLTVSAAEGPSGTSVVWPGTTRLPVHRPAHGGLTLTTAGTVPPVTASSPGAVLLTAAGLSVSFTAGNVAAPAPTPAVPTTSAAGTAAIPAQATPGASGRATVPSPSANAHPPLQVTCVLAPGQHAALGAVLVTGKARRAATKAGAVVGKCPKLPPGGLKLNPRFPPPPHPPPTLEAHDPSQGCAFTTGYADVRKLKGAALIAPALTNVNLTVTALENTNKNIDFIELDNVAELDFHGKHQFPPTTATFLSFGFVPTTATIELIEHGTINIFAVGPAGIQGSHCKPNKWRTCDSIATAFSRLSVQVVPGSVKVNGVPLDVGTHCATPQFDAILTGSSATNPSYNVQFGGPLLGTVNIPKFSNCGVTENLDPIFNAAISGPANFNLLTQGEVCFVQDALDCGPDKGPIPPKPLRKVSG